MHTSREVDLASSSLKSLSSCIRPLAVFLALGAGVSTIVSGQAPRARHNRTEYIRGREVVAGEVLVRFRPSAATTALERDLDVDANEPIGTARWRRLHSPRRTSQQLLTALGSRGDILAVEPNVLIHAVSIPDDPYFPQLWGLKHFTGESSDIQALGAWNVSTGSQATVVGVVDTGIDYLHPDLQANIWSAPGAFTVTIGHRTIHCPAGSHGFNAIALTCDPMDDHNHGTHVAGTIGAVGNNGLGVTGVNWTASLMGLKFLDASGTGTIADAINAIEFAVQAKARFAPGGGANVRVLSNSWGGGDFSQALLDEIERAGSADMLFVAAAGNDASNSDATPFYPAGYTASNVVAVAAIEDDGTLASFSNYGATSVDLAAPGVNIISTIAGGGYGSGSGTSMATPHVSGAAALVLSRCSLTTAQLKATLVETVTSAPWLAGYVATSGRLNAESAVRSCAAEGNAAPTVSLTAPSHGAVYTTPATITLSAAAADSDGRISRVDFYAGTTWVGAATDSPYTLAWNNPGAGNYTLTAIATDDDGASTASAVVAIAVRAPTGSLPSGWFALDVGSATPAGASAFSGGMFTVTGAGADIWGGADGFQFVYQSLAGDAELVARVATLQNTSGWAKAGVMIRDNLTAG
ncbi:MAG TPA: S8 family serine peptidase, partial [Candidatus Limnocylindrales bacterium]|nr:S8 family serine peptidase [Candidatus Limnocylindrales bacterium]